MGEWVYLPRSKRPCASSFMRLSLMLAGFHFGSAACAAGRRTCSFPGGPQPSQREIGVPLETIASGHEHPSERLVYHSRLQPAVASILTCSVMSSTPMLASLAMEAGTAVRAKPPRIEPSASHVAQRRAGSMREHRLLWVGSTSSHDHSQLSLRRCDIVRETGALAPCQLGAIAPVQSTPEGNERRPSRTERPRACAAASLDGPALGMFRYRARSWCWQGASPPPPRVNTKSCHPYANTSLPASPSSSLRGVLAECRAVRRAVA